MDFKKMNGLVPAIIQDAETEKVLMLGFMNEEALEKTRKEKKVTFYSRTKERLWTKGEESGNFLHVHQIIEDCDRDTLLIRVRPAGPVCHTGADTCFSEENKSADPEFYSGSGSNPDYNSPGSARDNKRAVQTGTLFLDQLQSVIDERLAQMPEGSYTTKLFNEGINKIAQKVGEEAVELVIEAKDDNNDLFINEAADLVYHLMVLLTQKGFAIADVARILEERHKK